MQKYKSTGWIIIRGAWFFDYVASLLYKIATLKELKISQCGQEAYVEKLERHHPWFLRNAAKMAFGVCVSRDTFTNSLC